MGGNLGATKYNGNTTLVDHGIQTEDADIRVHVCPQTNMAYIFSTELCKEAISAGNFIEKPAYTEIAGKNIVTGVGYLVPPEQIPECVGVDLLSSGSAGIPFSKSESTSLKGDKAVKVVKHLIDTKQFPVKMKVTDVNDKTMQISGTDIVIHTKLKIQVKCDYSGGPKSRGGTGNLYIQTKECNPNHAH